MRAVRWERSIVFDPFIAFFEPLSIPKERSGRIRMRTKGLAQFAGLLLGEHPIQNNRGSSGARPKRALRGQELLGGFPRSGG